MCVRTYVHMSLYWKFTPNPIVRLPGVLDGCHLEWAYVVFYILYTLCSMNTPKHDLDCLFCDFSQCSRPFPQFFAFLHIKIRGLMSELLKEIGFSIFSEEKTSLFEQRYLQKRGEGRIAESWLQVVCCNRQTRCVDASKTGPTNLAGGKPKSALAKSMKMYPEIVTCCWATMRLRPRFLVACTRLYTSLCRSVGRSISPSEITLLFRVFRA